MKTPVLFFILLGTFKLCSQQNLIYNGDFEIFDSCPMSISTPADYQIEHCLGWYSPTFATSDYYNTCALWPVNVPNNTFGTRYSQSGNGYCGILLENCNYPSCNGWWVEYLQSQLIEPLVSNKIYEFICYVGLSNNYYQYAFSEFGIHLSTHAINSVTSKPIDVIPTSINSKGNFIKDTLNWYEFKSIFVANGGEEFITLGFFIDSTNIDTLITDPFFDTQNYSSYYYIDNCSLKESNKLFSNVFTPNGDGVNDVWVPLDGFDKVFVLNRWGNVIRTLNIGDFWDGTDSSGQLLVESVYFFKWFSEDLIKTGFIQLMR